MVFSAKNEVNRIMSVIKKSISDTPEVYYYFRILFDATGFNAGITYPSETVYVLDTMQCYEAKKGVWVFGFEIPLHFNLLWNNHKGSYEDHIANLLTSSIRTHGMRSPGNHYTELKNEFQITDAEMKQITVNEVKHSRYFFFDVMEYFNKIKEDMKLDFRYRAVSGGPVGKYKEGFVPVLQYDARDGKVWGILYFSNSSGKFVEISNMENIHGKTIYMPDYGHEYNIIKQIKWQNLKGQMNGFRQHVRNCSIGHTTDIYKVQ